MALAIRRSALAEEDMIAIWLSIAQHSPKTADRIIDDFENAFAMLVENPHAGPARDDIRPGFRYFPKNPFLIIYIADSVSLTVIRVIDGRRNLAALDWPDAQ